MVSARQQAANVRNAAMSKGKMSSEGRLVVRLNAVKHGLAAKSIVLAHESITAFDEFRSALIGDFTPRNTYELHHLDEFVNSAWRLHRIRRVETGMLDNQLAMLKTRLKIEDAPGAKDENINNDEGIAVILTTNPPDLLKNYFRYDGSIERAYNRAVKNLESAIAKRDTSEAQLPNGIVR
jgi:hypothetical protein